MDVQLPTALAASNAKGQLTRDKAITSIVLPLSREVFAPAGSSSHLPGGSAAARWYYAFRSGPCHARAI